MPYNEGTKELVDFKKFGLLTFFFNQDFIVDKVYKFISEFLRVLFFLKINYDVPWIS